MKKRFQNILLKTDKKNGAVILMCAILLTLSLGTLVGCSVKNETAGDTSGQGANGNTEDQTGQGANGNTEDQTGQGASGNAVVQTGQPTNGSTENKTGQPESGNDHSAPTADAPGVSDTENSASGEILVYIHGFDGTALVYDEVEWVQVPGERAAELGLTEDDAPSGFSVYNAEAVTEEKALASDCICTLLDWTSDYAEMQVTLEELKDILTEREGTAIPYHLTIKGNEITGITEQYVP